MQPRLLAASLLIGLGLAVFLAAPDAAQRARPAGSIYQGQAFRFSKVQDGVYHAVGTGAIANGCNASIIVNDQDVLIVDSHASPAAAWVLMEELKAITSRPVRYVVNTHFHWDHAHGNQIYGPGVEIIGHEFTRQMLAAGESKRGRSWDQFIAAGIPAQIENLKKQLAAATDAAARGTLQAQLAVQEQYQAATGDITVVPPSLTLTNSMTLHRGGREIRLLFLGRGHTGGDVVVYLPKERVVMSGDLLTAGPAYLGDGFVPDWITTLDRLRGLDFEWVLPGHGDAFQGKAKIDHFQAYLRDFWQQAQTLHDARVGPEEAARRIDLRGQAANYPQIRDAGVLNHGVFRAYDLIDGRVK